MRIVLALFFTVTLGLNGCGGSSGVTTSTNVGNPITIILTISSPTIDGGQSASVDAALTNDLHADGVNFALDGAGALTYPPTTILSSPKLSCYYTPPAVVTTKFTATITATSTRDKSATATIPLSFTLP